MQKASVKTNTPTSIDLLFERQKSQDKALLNPSLNQVPRGIRQCESLPFPLY